MKGKPLTSILSSVVASTAAYADELRAIAIVKDSRFERFMGKLYVLQMRINLICIWAFTQAIFEKNHYLLKFTHLYSKKTVSLIFDENYEGKAMAQDQGSTGNVIAALCSLFFPGLGQLLQGRIFSAILWFVSACIAFAISWLITLSLLPFGWFLVSIFSCIGAARYRG
jgi:TM2 domain-containing membrane protein YozV